jgi:hypothetical protein
MSFTSGHFSKRLTVYVSRNIMTRSRNLLTSMAILAHCYHACFQASAAM